MPDGPTNGAADGGRHGLPGGTARAHEQPVASARPTPGIPRIAGPAITTAVCDNAHRANAGLRHAEPVPAGSIHGPERSAASDRGAASRPPGTPAPAEPDVTRWRAGVVEVQCAGVRAKRTATGGSDPPALLPWSWRRSDSFKRRCAVIVRWPRSDGWSSSRERRCAFQARSDPSGVGAAAPIAAPMSRD